MSNAAIHPIEMRWRDVVPAILPPLLVLAVVPAGGAYLSPWQFMWAVALAIYTCAKWSTWWPCRGDATLSRSLGYLLLWPGMNAEKFLSLSPAPASPSFRDWLLAAGRTVLGIALIWVVLPQLIWLPAMATAWLGMIGIALILHFGIFDLLANAWQSGGVAADRLMVHPFRSTSVAEYWGRRWNTAFRDLATQFAFHPLSRIISPKAALVFVFVASGLIHDLVISLPAGGGYGLPTLFFVIQAIAMLIERSQPGDAIGLRRGTKGWCFTAAAILLPAPLLFHSAFLTRVVLPMLHDLGALGS